MFSWSREQFKQHGVFAAISLIARVRLNRARTVVANKFLPASLKCPCCGWAGGRFYDYIEVGYRGPNASCPQCDSHPRHRVFYLWLQEDYRIKQRKGRALILGPER